MGNQLTTEDKERLRNNIKKDDPLYDLKMAFLGQGNAAKSFVKAFGAGTKEAKRVSESVIWGVIRDLTRRYNHQQLREFGKKFRVKYYYKQTLVKQLYHVAKYVMEATRYEPDIKDQNINELRKSARN